MTQKPHNKHNIALIGCGNMGGALIHNWVKKNLIKRAEILDPYDIDESLTSHPDLFHVKLMESVSFDDLDAVIIAVKPQILDAVCTELKQYINSDTLVVSIAAGKSSSYFLDKLNPHNNIIRCMPNTPAAVGKGANVLFAPKHISEQHKTLTHCLFNAAGLAFWVEDEALMDAVTALSGSGPAYVFHMIEVMAQAGIECGLPNDLAVSLARQTVIGASALADHSPNIDASTLRQNVTSPGGTTQAGLDVLMSGTFQSIMTQTLQAAKERSKELNQP